MSWSTCNAPGFSLVKAWIGTDHSLFQYASKLCEASATTGPAARTSRSAKLL